MQVSERGTGWLRNSLSKTDWQYAASPETVRSLSSVVDLDPLFPEPYDQASTNSCVGKSVVACFEYARQYQGLGHMDASTLFAYYVARMRGGNTASDNGSQIRDGILGLRDEGVCESHYWPFQPGAVTTRPPDIAFLRAREDVLVQFRSVQHTEQQLMGALAEGYAVVVGSLVFPGFRAPPNGIVPMPDTTRERPVGAHAYALSGYDATRARYPGVLFRIHNSWGHSWGQMGRGWIPGAYLTDAQLAADATAIEIVRDDTPGPVVPTPPPSPFWNIGPDTLMAMVANNHTPVSHEAYKIDEHGVSMGWSEAIAIDHGGGLWRYTYVASLRRVNQEPM